MARDEVKVVDEKTDDKPPFFITPPYGILLHGSQEMPIGLCHLYKGSAAQLTRLHYSENSVKLVKKRLRVLADHGFVEFDAMPTARHRSPYYYVLGNSGVEYIKSLGMSISGSYHPSKKIGQNYLHLLHHAGANDVLIAAAILKRQVPEYTLADFKLARELASEPFSALWHGKPYGSVPDLFLTCSLTSAKHYQMAGNVARLSSSSTIEAPSPRRSSVVKSTPMLA